MSLPLATHEVDFGETDSGGVDILKSPGNPNADVLNYRLELSVSACNIQFRENECKVILSIEQGGASHSTTGVAALKGSNSIQFEDSLVLNLSVAQCNNVDSGVRAPIASNLESIVGRVTFREENCLDSGHGAVIDYAVIDLATFIGEVGVYEMPVRMELGSNLLLRGQCRLRGVLAEGSEETTGGEVVEGKGIESGGCHGTRRSTQRLSNVTLEDSHEEGSFRDRGSGFQTSATTLGDHALSEAQLSHLESMEDDEAGDTSGAGQVNPEDDVELTSEGHAEDHQNHVSGVCSESESSPETSLQNTEISRIQNQEHPFLPLLSIQLAEEEYSAIVDEGPWIEIPQISTVASPLPLAIWSIQGPEEIDPDDVDDMMDIGDGVMAPARNIAKLQNVSAGPSTGSEKKRVSPALPGQMSPLQRINLKPSETRQAAVIALGRPPDPSKCTALAASRTLALAGIDVEEPNLSDSERSGSDDESDDSSDSGDSEGSVANDVSEDEDSKEEEKLFLVTQNRSGSDELHMSTSNAKQASQIRYGEDDGNSTRMAADHQQQQLEQLREQIGNLEAECSGVQQMVKEGRQNVRELQEERAQLKKRVDEKDLQLFDFDETDGEMQASVAALRKENAEVQHMMDAIAAEMAEIRKATHGARAEAEKLRIEIGSEGSLMRENERLQVVVESLERELVLGEDRRRSVDLLVGAKSELAMEMAECQGLRHEIAQLKSKSGVGIGAFFKKSKARA